MPLNGNQNEEEHILLQAELRVELTKEGDLPTREESEAIRKVARVIVVEVAEDRTNQKPGPPGFLFHFSSH